MKPEKPRILYGEANADVLARQAKFFEKSGYPVTTALGRKAIQEAVLASEFDLVILGHTLSKDDRHHVPYVATKRNPDTRVLVLHASGKHPEVDIALDSREGDAKVLDAIAQLVDVPRTGRLGHSATVATH